jgi:D-alanine-D-alanine ligase
MAAIAVLFGGPSPEHDISILTGLQVARILANAGQDVSGLYWTKSGDWFQVAASLEARDFTDGPPKASTPFRLVVGTDGGFHEDKRKLRPVGFEVAVNCCHGGPGEDGALQAALDLAGVTYTGPSAAAAALAMDKASTHALALANGLPVADQALLTPTTTELAFAGPYIVKPRFGGSSIGIEVVDDLATAQALLSSSRHLRDGAVIEQYLTDWVDLNVAVRTYPETEVSPVERPLRKPDGSIFTYAEKYLSGSAAGMEHAPRELPAALPDGVAPALTAAATTLAQAARIRGVARVDFLWDGAGGIVFNEINSIPGAMALHLWEAGGVTKLATVQAMVAEAQARPARVWSSAGADGTALRSAGAIAAKLS